MPDVEKLKKEELLLRRQYEPLRKSRYVKETVLNDILGDLGVAKNIDEYEDFFRGAMSKIHSEIARINAKAEIGPTVQCDINGAKCSERWPDGKRVEFVLDGVIKAYESFPDGRTIVYRYGSGFKLAEEFPDGRIVEYGEDGKTEVASGAFDPKEGLIRSMLEENESGARRIPEAKFVVPFKDGRVAMYRPNGTKYYESWPEKLHVFFDQNGFVKRFKKDSEDIPPDRLKEAVSDPKFSKKLRGLYRADMPEKGKITVFAGGYLKEAMMDRLYYYVKNGSLSIMAEKDFKSDRSENEPLITFGPDGFWMRNDPKEKMVKYEGKIVVRVAGGETKLEFFDGRFALYDDTGWKLNEGWAERFFMANYDDYGKLSSFSGEPKKDVSPDKIDELGLDKKFREKVMEAYYEDALEYFTEKTGGIPGPGHPFSRAVAPPPDCMIPNRRPPPVPRPIPPPKAEKEETKVAAAPSPSNGVAPAMALPVGEQKEAAPKIRRVVKKVVRKVPDSVVNGAEIFKGEKGRWVERLIDYDIHVEMDNGKPVSFRKGTYGVSPENLERLGLGSKDYVAIVERYGMQLNNTTIAEQYKKAKQSLSLEKNKENLVVEVKDDGKYRGHVVDEPKDEVDTDSLEELLVELDGSKGNGGGDGKR
jgi:hypothetical protein